MSIVKIIKKKKKRRTWSYVDDPARLFEDDAENGKINGSSIYSFVFFLQCDLLKMVNFKLLHSAVVLR